MKLLITFLIIISIFVVSCGIDSGVTENSVIDVKNVQELEADKPTIDCPWGEVNCQYPGRCGAYVDTDKNQICDHSE